jgi:hypothetical protein
MPAINNLTSTTPTSRNLSERLELANRLYREYLTQCFWHCRRDLEITEELIPFVVKGLRSSGGRRGFILASKLLSSGATPSEREPPECR